MLSRYPILARLGILATLRRNKDLLRATLKRLEMLRDHTVSVTQWGELVMLGEELKIYARNECGIRRPNPPHATDCLTKSDKETVLALRYLAGCQLYHPDDLRPDSPRAAVARAAVAAGKRKSRGNGDGTICFEEDPNAEPDEPDDVEPIRMYDPC